MILCSDTPKKDLNTLQSNTINDLIRVTKKMIENLENGKKQTYCLYEAIYTFVKEKYTSIEKKNQVDGRYIESKK